LQKTSLVDYPGHVAATVFTIGCNMRCGYCHNPELVLPEQYLDPIPVNDILDWCETRIGKLDGIAITGGEPTMHAGLVDFCRELKSMGFLIKLDSNGTHPDMLEQMIGEKIIDFVAMDIKGPIDRYSEIAARPIDTDTIQRTVRLLIDSGTGHEFRTTIVRSQLDASDFERIGTLVEGAQRFALQKFQPGKTLSPQFEFESSYNDYEMKELQTIMEKYVKQCVIH
ncbi:MAG: anaerobic ribonucleoside-triphosphate reductase activating protein, partial [Spartobacteria bacterium]|nr:anaerobic ribonucleoside-triphosphate reductase activating protein [Spartobacteria bacterium]